MDIIDERLKGPDPSLVRDFWRRAPVFAKVVLLAVTLGFLYALKSRLQDIRAGKRERLCVFHSFFRG